MRAKTRRCNVTVDRSSQTLEHDMLKTAHRSLLADPVRIIVILFHTLLSMLSLHEEEISASELL